LWDGQREGFKNSVGTNDSGRGARTKKPKPKNDGWGATLLAPPVQKKRVRNRIGLRGGILNSWYSGVGDMEVWEAR